MDILRHNFDRENKIQNDINVERRSECHERMTFFSESLNVNGKSTPLAMTYVHHTLEKKALHKDDLNTRFGG